MKREATSALSDSRRSDARAISAAIVISNAVRFSFVLRFYFWAGSRPVCERCAD